MWVLRMRCIVGDPLSRAICPLIESLEARRLLHDGSSAQVIFGPGHAHYRERGAGRQAPSLAQAEWRSLTDRPLSRPMSAPGGTGHLTPKEVVRV